MNYFEDPLRIIRIKIGELEMALRYEYGFDPEPVKEEIRILKAELREKEAALEYEEEIRRMDTDYPLD